MSEDIYDLSGPFTEGIKSLDASQLASFSVTVRHERNSASPLNPVAQLRRVISIGHDESTEALLIISPQFLEVFTIVSESKQQESPQDRSGPAGSLARRLKHAASTGAGHVVPHRLRRSRDVSKEDEGPALEADDPDQLGKVQGILKDHVLSIGVAMSQILKLRLSGSEITVFYHPNGIKSAKYGKFLAGAARFSFWADSEQEALKVMEIAQARINRLNQAAAFLRSDMVLPSELRIIAVTRSISAAQARSDKDEELVVAKDPAWGVSVPAPPCWGPKANGSQLQLWVYLSTPLGDGKAEIAPQTVAQYVKNGHASFYVGVRHPQAQSAVLSNVSRLQRVSTHTREHENDELDEDDDSDESWQPEHSDESSGPSISSPSTSLGRPSTPGRVLMANGRNGRHIRLHCSATYIDNQCKPKFSRQILAPNPSHVSQGPILEGINGQRNQILGGCIFLALLCLLLGYRQAAVLLANLAFATFTFTSRQSREERNIVPVQSSTQPRDNEDSGEWKVILIRAELIKDEPWSESGSSVVAHTEADDSEEGVDNRMSELAKEFHMSDDEIDRYMLAFNNDEALAHRRLAATYAWRKANNALDILHQPAPNFKFFKSMFHHALLGTTKEGHPIWFMKVGDMKSGFKTFKQSALTSKDLARHVALCMDYMYQVVETASLPNGRALWVLDLKGMGLTDIGSEAFDLGKEIAGLISAHWPERLYRAFVINMPGFFSVLWKLIEPMMAASTRRKIRLLRGKDNMIKEMTEEMSLDDIPIEYGGRLDAVYHATKETEFWKYVDGLSSQ